VLNQLQHTPHVCLIFVEAECFGSYKNRLHSTRSVSFPLRHAHVFRGRMSLSVIMVTSITIFVTKPNFTPS